MLQKTFLQLLVSTVSILTAFTTYLWAGDTESTGGFTRNFTNTGSFQKQGRVNPPPTRKARKNHNLHRRKVPKSLNVYAKDAHENVKALTNPPHRGQVTLLREKKLKYLKIIAQNLTTADDAYFKNALSGSVFKLLRAFSFWFSQNKKKPALPELVREITTQGYDEVFLDALYRLVQQTLPKQEDISAWLLQGSPQDLPQEEKDTRQKKAQEMAALAKIILCEADRTRWVEMAKCEFKRLQYSGAPAARPPQKQQHQARSAIQDRHLDEKKGIKNCAADVDRMTKDLHVAEGVDLAYIATIIGSQEANYFQEAKPIHFEWLIHGFATQQGIVFSNALNKLFQNMLDQSLNNPSRWTNEQLGKIFGVIRAVSGTIAPNRTQILDKISEELEQRGLSAAAPQEKPNATQTLNTMFTEMEISSDNQPQEKTSENPQNSAPESAPLKEDITQLAEMIRENPEAKQLQRTFWDAHREEMGGWNGASAQPGDLATIAKYIDTKLPEFVADKIRDKIAKVVRQFASMPEKNWSLDDINGIASVIGKAHTSMAAEGLTSLLRVVFDMDEHENIRVNETQTSVLRQIFTLNPNLYTREDLIFISSVMKQTLPPYPAIAEITTLIP